MPCICYHDFPTDNLPTWLWIIVECYVWWFVGYSVTLSNYRWAASGDLPPCMEVWPEETPWIVLEIRRWYRRAPLLLSRINFNCILKDVLSIQDETAPASTGTAASCPGRSWVKTMCSRQSFPSVLRMTTTRHCTATRP